MACTAAACVIGVNQRRVVACWGVIDDGIEEHEHSNVVSGDPL